MQKGKQNIFITGGAGYVGAVLVPKLLANGDRVTVYDLLIFGVPCHRIAEKIFFGKCQILFDFGKSGEYNTLS